MRTDIKRLTVDLKSARNGELYYARKYILWKEHATVNRIGNFRMTENYLNLESYCEGLKEQLLRYQTIIYGNEVYKEHASFSKVNQVFPALPMRPELVPNLYFAAEDLKDIGVQQIVKATYCQLETDVEENVKASLVDVKGKCPTKLSLTKAYKNCIQKLAEQKKGSTNVVVRP